jgi:IclR family acetate operon transcriptional repressor
LKENDYTIQSLAAALDVIDCLVASNGIGRGITEIGHQTGFTKSRVFRILDTLGQRGYVQKDPETQKYHLGPGFLVVGEAFRDGLDLRLVAEPILEDLAERSGDTAHLLALSGLQAVTIDIKRGRHFLQVSESVGQPFPLYIGAVPKILLAYLPEPERKAIIKRLIIHRHTQRTTVRKGDLEAELKQIRSQGYWIAKDDYEAGIFAVGAAVREHTGRVIAGVSLTSPQVRHSVERERRNTQLVIEAARELSERLGYREGTANQVLRENTNRQNRG